MKTSSIILAATIILLGGCKKGDNDFDASGTFEAIETVISAEANGTLKQFNVEEGQQLKTNEQVGYIDSVQLYLRKKQLESQKAGLSSRMPDISAQTAAFKQQLVVTESQLKTQYRERQRIQNLVNADAVPTKQLDDVNAQIDVLEKQLKVIKEQDAAQQSVLNTQTKGLQSDKNPIQAQIEQLEDQLAKCKIINPVNGTVLVKYVEPNEMVMQGKALYKIADMSYLNLRAYITGDQLSKVKIDQKVKVLTDDGADKYKEQEGVITWINDKAEFTPKTIQTKEERANLVYAIKVRVKNDGYLKIGMYGEVKF
ncbi:efflux RND transporter periplasmic adaptor subunit [Solitalea sp. MAHUQ-68]|uniref:Efflux RND transporter periplasmic adaptor subunit n=1 Tax=Solitalea agri TaxID=2953739 RepID=A0A9X2F063_9SPHI|nr:efflux RND transporter periplasmic adaptor subunit [Solitalea agri]MCO4292292.1 efflux RND transporter periplasmic adaptor subunit [Solitalea agri]